MSPERTIGETIRQAREARQMSQQDVSRETRLSLAVLRSIETDQFAEMPHDLYTENALRMLADSLGLDRAELMARYRDGPGPAPGTGTRESVWGEEGVPETRVQGLRLGRRTWLSLLALLVLAILAWLIASGRFSRPARDADNSESQSAIEVEAVEMPPQRAEPAAASETPDQDDAPLPDAALSLWGEGPLIPVGAVRGTTLRREAALELLVTAVADCRLQVNADGRRHLARTLLTGERWRLRAAEYLVLSASDGSALELSLDGEPYVLPGDLPAGRPLALRIDPRPAQAAEGS